MTMTTMIMSSLKQYRVIARTSFLLVLSLIVLERVSLMFHFPSFVNIFDRFLFIERLL